MQQVFYQKQKPWSFLCMNTRQSNVGTLELGKRRRNWHSMYQTYTISLQSTDIRKWIRFPTQSTERYYMSDETQLLGKCFPTKAVCFQTEQSALNHKSSKKRITVLCFVNTTSAQKVKLCVRATFRKHITSKEHKKKTIPSPLLQSKRSVDGSFHFLKLLTIFGTGEQAFKIKTFATKGHASLGHNAVISKWKF